jgi:membrane protein
VVYGSLGAVIILMLWFYMTGVTILIGGEVNAIIEQAAARTKVRRGSHPVTSKTHVGSSASVSEQIRQPHLKSSITDD